MLGNLRHVLSERDRHPTKISERFPQSARDHSHSQVSSLFSHSSSSTVSSTSSSTSGNTSLVDRNEPPRAVIVGGGVVGVSTAYSLARKGYRVVVIDSSSSSGGACSAAAAGGMARSNPLTDRSTWLAVAKNLMPDFPSFLQPSSPTSPSSSSETPAALRPTFRYFRIDWVGALSDPHFLRWSLQFAKNSLIGGKELRAKQDHMLNFTDWAIGEVTRVMKEEDGGKLAETCGYGVKGFLKVDVEELWEAERSHPTSHVDSPSISSLGSPSTFCETTSPVTVPASQAITMKNDKEPSYKLTVAQLLHIEPWLSRCRTKHVSEDGSVSRLAATTAAAAAAGKATGGAGAASEASDRDAPTSTLLQRTVFQPEVAMADCHRFTKRLAEICSERYDVEFLYNTPIETIVTEPTSTPQSSGVRVTALVTKDGRSLEVPPNTPVVVAAGSWSPHLLASCGFFLPVFPLKGYDLIVDLPTQEEEKEMCGEHPDCVSGRSLSMEVPRGIVSNDFVYMARVGPRRVRVASIGEFSAWDTSINEDVVDSLKMEAVRLCPALGNGLLDIDNRAGSGGGVPNGTGVDRYGCHTVTGLRPFTSDGIIMLGRVSNDVDNLYVTAGPGYNGWKTAIGAGEVLACQIEVDIGRDEHGEGLREVEEKGNFRVAALSPIDRVSHNPLWCRMTRWRWARKPSNDRWTANE
eukprot:TRINITY_DN945_c0_g1_i1.p1 TRINITY_DN945_c0_g1~~TRINITY_DN945_c0_g1_i1.p1  ORF type:complete len:691 (-),score=105.27 TRINITY_DN945_c0_g1_i1:28-2100(-)